MKTCCGGGRAAGGGGSGLAAGRGGGGNATGGGGNETGAEEDPVGIGPRMGLGMTPSGSFRFSSSALCSAIALTCVMTKSSVTLGLRNLEGSTIMQQANKCLAVTS
jgi:hypothetical protein